ncbi:MAG TPA: hypothetical protein VMD74_00985, partial [Candidatus Methylomirabilis sp.]|nr:hypothetical protein [Candidatus Methylomirabilis sp.]
MSSNREEKIKRVHWNVNRLENFKGAIFSFPRAVFLPALIFILVFGWIFSDRPMLGLLPAIEKAQAAIGLENVGTANAFSAANPTVALTVTSANLVIVEILIKDGTAVTGVSDSDGAFTLARADGNTGDPPRTEIWYQKNPTAGAKTITAAINSGTLLGILNAFGLTGTDTGAPLGAVAGITGSGMSAQNSITTLYNNSWIISLAGNSAGGAITNNVSQTQIWNRAVGGLSSARRTADATYELKAAAGSDNQIFTISNGGNWALSSIEIKMLNAVPDPAISGMTTCSAGGNRDSDCGFNAAPEYDSGDTYGLIQLNGTNFGASAGTIQFTGAFGTIAGTV